ncbi:MAG: hypothetical protein EP335_09410 [Alphaproteobacteria bacterium]|nr:MAG: hypothetical protein EP335_09410 [Alphaproteobacteria bacterium]
MATVYLFDPGLAGYNGHYARWDQEFVGLFAARAIPVRVFGHQRFPDPSLAGAPVVPHFSQTLWHMDDRTDLLKNWDTYFRYNKLMTDELVALGAGRHKGQPGWRPGRGDLVIVPTILQFQLSGLVQWFNMLPEGDRPTMLCYLMGPAGCTAEDGGQKARIWSVDTARFYKLAFRAADNNAPGIDFFACGESLAEDYSALRGRTVEPYALLNSGLRPDAPLRQTDGRHALLYAGGPRLQKGLDLLPQMVRTLCSRHPDWTFSIQACSHVVDAQQKKLEAALKPLADRFGNLRLYLDRLSDDAYFDLFDTSDIVAAPYARDYYAHNTSGVVWEAVGVASTLVVPANTWLAREPARLGAGYVTFGDHTAAAVADAVSRAIEAPPLDRAGRIAAAERFKARNRRQTLVTQIAARWPALAGQAG